MTWCIPNVWAVLKCSCNDTCHHFSTKCLQRCVDRSVFCLSEDNAEVNTIDYMEAMAEKVDGKRITCRELIR